MASQHSLATNHPQSTTSTPKQRHLAQLASRLAELASQTERLARLSKITACQATDQHELAIYYGSMLMATTRVFNLDEITPVDSEEEENSASSPN
ncbi:uncharacterized protein VP01_2562g5 [Puccinia sorghi]|uniref:Uncharacterized protein n=1 Tax=Puccinia sorghi TaxID=27349 RepID=A0A0L6V579_9BASI|nr:uncharacterized protein VP01_2562g5 [Puccinia sorghi]